MSAMQQIELASPAENGIGNCVICSVEDRATYFTLIGRGENDKQNALAASIVRAVNAYDDMLAALRVAQEMAEVMCDLTSNRGDDEWVWGIQAKINAAILNADGRQ